MIISVDNPSRWSRLGSLSGEDDREPGTERCASTRWGQVCRRIPTSKRWPMKKEVYDYPVVANQRTITHIHGSRAEWACKLPATGKCLCTEFCRWEKALRRPILRVQPKQGRWHGRQWLTNGIGQHPSLYGARKYSERQGTLAFP